MPRQSGRPMTNQEREGKSLKSLLQQVLQFIRTDFGGQSDKVKVVSDKVKQYCKDQSINLSDEGVALVAKFAIEWGTHQVESCRKRLTATVEELYKREETLANIRLDLERLQAKGSATGEELAAITKKVNQVVAGDKKEILF